MIPLIIPRIPILNNNTNNNSNHIPAIPPGRHLRNKDNKELPIPTHPRINGLRTARLSSRTYLQVQRLRIMPQLGNKHPWGPQETPTWRAWPLR